MLPWPGQLGGRVVSGTRDHIKSGLINASQIHFETKGKGNSEMGFRNTRLLLEILKIFFK